MRNWLARCLLEGRLARWALLLLAAFVLLPLDARSSSAQQVIPESYALVGENERFQLYLDAATLAFKLRDRRSDST